jgi:FAD/FMN-containing dehydrogenase
MVHSVCARTLGGRTVGVSADDLRQLRGALRGDLLAEDHPDYDKARRLWNGLVDKRPALIARCREAADVIQALRWAAVRDLVVSVRGGGHNVAGHAVADGGLVIDLGLMRSVQVEASTRTAKVAGGATLGDVDAATTPLGFAVPLGLVSETGIAGLTLHGGYGWLARKHGLTIDSLIGAEVVTVDGSLLNASAGENSDLFWALRGGGGNFGVVTSFSFRLQPVPPEVWFAAVFYPMNEAQLVIARLRDRLASSPRELGLLAAFWSSGASAPFPEEARFMPVVAVIACWTGAERDGDQEIRWLRELGPKPLADFSGRRSYVEAQRFFDDDYPRGRLYYWKSLYLSELSNEVLQELQVAGRERPSTLSSVDVWFLDGAPGDVDGRATAFARRNAPYLIAIEANWDDAASTQVNVEWARESWRRLARHCGGEAYLNFPGFAEEANDLVRSAFGDNYPRLRAIKRRYDPFNRLRGNFNIPPASGRSFLLESAARLARSTIAKARRVRPGPPH